MDICWQKLTVGETRAARMSSLLNHAADKFKFKSVTASCKQLQVGVPVVYAETLRNEVKQIWKSSIVVTLNMKTMYEVDAIPDISNIHTSMGDDLLDAHQRSSFQDMTLAAGNESGKVFPCHRVLLTARSFEFQINEPGLNRSIVLSGVDDATETHTI